MRASLSHGHGRTATFVGKLMPRGMMAPFVLSGPINRHAFEICVEKPLVSALRPGDVVVTDNLGSHKGPRTGTLIEAAGADLRFLLPWAPGLNPVENAFSKLKALLRKAAERTVERLSSAIGRIVTTSDPSECANCFSACGYDSNR